MKNINRGSVWVWVLFGAGILLAGFAVYYLFFSQGDISKTAINQLELIKNNKVTDAYNLNSDDFKKYTTLAQFTQSVKVYPILGNYYRYNINEKKIKDKKGCVKVSLFNQDNSGIIVYYGLSNINGWKISAMKINPKNATSCDILLGTAK